MSKVTPIRPGVGLPSAVLAWELHDHIGESDVEWWAWWTWLGSGIVYDDREPPTADAADLAARFRWAERAALTLERLARNRAAKSKAEFAAIVAEIRDNVAEDIRRVSRDSRGVFAVKDLIALWQLSESLGGNTVASEIDVDRLAIDDQRTLRALLAKARRAA